MSSPSAVLKVLGGESGRLVVNESYVPIVVVHWEGKVDPALVEKYFSWKVTRLGGTADRGRVVLVHDVTLVLRPDASLRYVGVGISCTDTELHVVRTKVDSAGEGTFGLSAFGCDVTVEQSEFRSATEVGMQAWCNGALCETDPVDVSVTRSWFEDNEAALYLEVDTATVVNNVIARNHSAGDYGQIVALINESDSLFAYNTISGNRNGEGWDGVISISGNGSTTITSNLSWDNCTYNCDTSPNSDYAAMSGNVVQYNLSSTTLPGPSNNTGDPLFVAPGELDYTPGERSPALDTADPENAPTVDFYGNPRSVGDGPDRGAIEAQWAE